MWGTELFGNGILNISAAGLVREFKIPTSNSRPIAIIPDSLVPSMWFTEEAGQKIGKIDMYGNITEYPVPVLQKTDILASLTFDLEGNLTMMHRIRTAAGNTRFTEMMINKLGKLSLNAPLFSH